MTGDARSRSRRLLEAAGLLERSGPLPADMKPVCCLVHVYYPELWPELAGYISNFGDIPVDLHVNLVESTATPGLEGRIRADFPDARIRRSPNRGRDMGGFFALLQDVDFDRHDIFCLLHTKKSPHLVGGGGRQWRRSLVGALLRNRTVAAANVLSMIEDPSIGLIGARRHRTTRLLDNAEYYHAFLDRLGITGRDRDCEFLAGSIMFLRSGVLRRLYETFNGLQFEDGDTMSLKQHLDGQIAHALERVIGNIVKAEGLRFRWR